MPIVVWQTLKEPKHTPVVKGKIQAFLSKLQKDDKTLGLHIEPITNSKDPRVRTGRVDQFWRAMLFRFDPPSGEPVYVYAGTWPHDDAIEKARRTVAKQNPVNSLVAFTEVLDGLPEVVSTRPAASPYATREEGSTQTGAAASPSEGTSFADSGKDISLLRTLKFVPSDLVEDFGFDSDIAERAFECATEDDLLEYALSLSDLWQQDVLTAMGAGTALHEIRERLALYEDEELVATTEALKSENEDARIVAALQLPAARMQFHFIEDDDDLRRVIEGGDFGAWRVFLHPEQRRYVERDYNGAFRLSGGAGTGKTVVLLHRARWLHKQNPDARIVLSTFSRALAENLTRDLERLDSSIVFASELGQPGVLVRGVDQLAAEVRRVAGASFGESMHALLGAERDLGVTPCEPDWRAAVDDVLESESPAFAGEITQPGFYEDEYAQVVLPVGMTTREEFFGVRRPGRGIALNRAKRALVWRTVEQMRANERLDGHISFAEIAACASHWLSTNDTYFADHVLVDEGQDLEPAKWKFMRALVAEGANDLFIADDSHQRIYGQATVFSRYGIRIRGRSRRLTLNYRTTLENLRYALGLLEGVDYTDSEEESLGLSGYRSVRTGPRPRIHAASTDQELLDSVARDLEQWRNDGISGGSIAILVSSNFQAEKLQQSLEAMGQRVIVAGTRGSGRTGEHPVLLTMQRAKGLEFSRVILFDLSKQSFPPRAAVRGLTGGELENRLQQFRSQLYVAASRARDELVVTWVGDPSNLLDA